MRRLWFPILLGVLGVAVLCGLGVWQLGRLAQKEALIDRVEARIGAEPVALPEAPDPEADEFLPVAATGDIGGGEVHVLTSLPGEGPGYRVVAVLDAGGRRILADLGYIPEAAKAAPRAARGVTVTGNLHWPDEADSWTPPPDPEMNIWFARDVGAMAEALGTEPLLLVAQRVEGADLGATPLPVDSSSIRNDHGEYAATWFGLAAVWAVMSLVLIRRVRRGQA